MSSSFGKNIKVTIFGQSHSQSIGVCIDGLPAGLAINFNELDSFLKRRSPGNQSYSTKRKEPDIIEILSGIVNGFTCGAPLTAIIKNIDMKSSDYDELYNIPRPSHADYTAQVKYHGYQDVSGGGHFSGRLTAPLCIAGGICMQLLKTFGIEIAAHISNIGGITDLLFDMTDVSKDDFEFIKNNIFPVIDADKGLEMQTLIDKVKKNGDSIGGIVECAAIGIPAGIGEPIFEGIENRISAVIFGIPAVKGIEFGNGFKCAALKGSENNDCFYIDEKGIKTKTNNHGGILGGITSGMPIIFRAVFKPTPSIALEQDSVSLSKNENIKLLIKGRHDPCIVPRAVPCVEAAAAIAICDVMYENNNLIRGVLNGFK